MKIKLIDKILIAVFVFLFILASVELATGAADQFTTTYSYGETIDGIGVTVTVGGVEVSTDSLNTTADSDGGDSLVWTILVSVTDTATHEISLKIWWHGQSMTTEHFTYVPPTPFNILTDSVMVDVSAALAVDGLLEQATDLNWDEPLTASTHDVGNSAGKRIRLLESSMIIRAETAQGPFGANNRIQLDVGASADDGAYDPAGVTIIGGTGMGQTRIVLQYDGTNKVAIVDRDWKVNPDATSEFIIFSHAGREHVNEGEAQGGTANTITLNALASSSDSVYVGQIVFIRGGAGQDQMGLVVDYNGTTKVATTQNNWKVVPDTSSSYVMYPFQIHDISTLALEASLFDPATTPVIIDDTTITGDQVGTMPENWTTADSAGHQGAASGLTAADINTNLTANHGAGAWTSGGLGSGAYTYQIFAVDTSGTDQVVPYATIFVQNAAGSPLGSAGDVSGAVTFNVEDSIVFGVRANPAYVFANNGAYVAANGIDTVYGYNVVGSSPASADFAVVEGYERLINGDTLVGGIVEVYRQDGNASVSGSNFNIGTLYRADTTDADGYWSTNIYLTNVYDQNNIGLYTFIMRYENREMWKLDTMRVTATGTINIADTLSVR